MGILAHWSVRRRWWELFHVSHHIFMALFLSTLWHATASWQYVLAGLSLWFLDRLMRLGHSTRRVVVKDLIFPERSPEGKPYCRERWC